MRWTQAARVLVVVLAVGGCAAPPGTSAGAPAPLPQQPPRVVATAQTAVGALFEGPDAAPGGHFCSGSVLDTGAGDLVLTAAHCVADGDGTPAHTNLVFAPGYHDGVAPYGVWSVVRATVGSRWLDAADPDADVAVLTLGRADGDRSIRSVTGGFPVDVDGDGAGLPVDAVGYPSAGEEATTRSGTTTAFSPTQLELDAFGLEDGTSGGPWLHRPQPGGPERTDGSGDDAAATVVGLTGGYEEGGYTPDVSYSPVLGPDVATLLDQAAALDDEDRSSVRAAPQGPP